MMRSCLNSDLRFPLFRQSRMRRLWLAGMTAQQGFLSRCAIATIVWRGW
ncbi:hypothetical protein [Marinobacter daqiaonensis]|nr:hypothetical protein [Marinobacter daqiaonensis]